MCLILNEYSTVVESENYRYVLQNQNYSIFAFFRRKL
jgi:hypothetical protein